MLYAGCVPAGIAPAEAAEEVIIVLVIVAQFAAPQPTGDGLASLSQQGSGQQRHQPPSQARMQQTGQL